jgi:putative CocE/NonD family hydrolase
MKRFIFFWLLVSVAFCACAKPQESAYVKAHFQKIEAYIPMRDGVRLFTAIYVPKDTTKQYPMLMTRTPYSVAPYGEDDYPASVGPSRLLMEEGYIFVYQDVRGRWMSEGIFDEMCPIEKDIDESTDTYDTIEWLLANLRPHNGRVGMWGISYSGFYTSAGMLSGHPALKASSPQAPIADLWRDDAFHYGVFLIPHNFNFYPYFTNRTGGQPTQEQPKGFRHGTNDGYKYFLEMGPLKNSLQSEAHANDPYWKANLEHPAFDAHWQARSILPHLKGIRHAVLVAGGWYDAEDLHGTFKTYQAIEQNNPGIDNIFVVGPWSHGAWAWEDGDRLGDVSFGEKTSRAFQQMELAFFNYYLKDKGEGKFPEARMFETGANRWRSFDQWPPAEAREESLFFQPGGGLTIGKAPRKKSSYSEYVSDPNNPVPSTGYPHIGMPQAYMTDDQRFAAQRPDVLVFQTEVLKDPVTLAGDILAHLEVSTTGTDADWVVKVIDVYPDKGGKMAGYQQMVRSEFFRMRYRNSFEFPESAEPGQVYELNFELQDVLHTFKKGHRIMVQVQSSFFPIADRNPQQYVANIFYAEPGDFQKATHRVYHDAEHASHLEVRLLE